MAVQIVRNHRGKVTILEHSGSAHTEAGLTVLLAAGEDKLVDYGATEQLELELGLPTVVAAPSRARTVAASQSSVLIDAITQSWKRLGFGDAINDNAFFHLVLARLVEPTSKADSLRVLAELGIEPLHHMTTEWWSRASRCSISIMQPAGSYWDRRGQLDLGYTTISAAAVPAPQPVST